MVFPVLSTKLIDGVMAVHRALGPGLLEGCYHNALYYEYRAMGLQVLYNAPFTVKYKGEVVGEYLADLAVSGAAPDEGRVILELKSVAELSGAMRAQVINYLRISGFRLGFLVNFNGRRPVWERFVV